MTLITGATSGIGRALAQVFAEHGHDLVLTGRRRGPLAAVAASLTRRRRVAAHAIAADLAEPRAPAALMRRLAERGLTVSVLVNNAGLGTYGRFTETDWRVEREMLDVNIAALMALTKLALPGMLARGSGTILNVASTAAFQPGPLMAVYYASKACVLSFSEALTEELAGTGVTVTALCPGPTRTDFQRRAGRTGSRAMGRGPLPGMSADAVARIGYEAAIRGRPVVVAGTLNAAAAAAVRWAPRGLVRRIVRRLNERRLNSGRR